MIGNLTWMPTYSTLVQGCKPDSLAHPSARCRILTSIAMKYLGAVSSEGGPLLLADARLARDWRGSDEDGSDYARACDLFAGEERPGGPISIGQGQGIVWDLEDAGTADVFRVETGRIVLVGAWLDEPND